MVERTDGDGWNEQTSASLQRLLGRMESKIDALDRGFVDLRRDMRERTEEYARTVDRRLDAIEAGKASRADVELLKRIVFGAVGVICLAFLGGLVVVRFNAPSPVPSIAGAPR